MGYSTVFNPATKEEKRIDWTSKGTWCVPSWHKFTHTAIEGTAVRLGRVSALRAMVLTLTLTLSLQQYLFTYNDFPMLEKLDFYASDM